MSLLLVVLCDDEMQTDQKTESTKARILTLLKDNTQLTKADLMKILGKSRGTINEHIINLKNEGLLERVGGRKQGHWEVLTKSGG